MSTYTNSPKLTGYADSALATGRVGRSAFTLLVDFAKVGAPAATGLVATDVIDEIGALPQNCAVRSVVAQVLKPITVLSEDGISAIPLSLKKGSTEIASLSLAGLNGPALGAQWDDVNLANGRMDVDDGDTTLSLTVGAVLDNAGTPKATAITGGQLLIAFFVDYMPEADELTALSQDITDYVSDGGNAAGEATLSHPYG